MKQVHDTITAREEHFERVEQEALTTDDQEVLNVYADMLIERGDVRGELIATELRMARNGGNTRLAERHNELLTIWLGDNRPSGQIEHGFIDVDATGSNPVEQIEEAFSGRGSEYIRSVRVAGPQRTLCAAIDTIGQVERRRMLNLELCQWDNGSRYQAWTAKRTVASRFGIEDPPMENETFARLVHATPNLRSLAISGKTVFHVIAHPNVMTMRVSGYRAAKIGVCGRLVELDLAFHSQLADARTATPPSGLLATVLDCNALPSLIRLDLSRNGPGAQEPWNLGGAVNSVRFLSGLSVLPQLRSLRLPPFRSLDDAPLLQTLLDRMPHLEELGFPRLPDEQAHLLAELRHSGANIWSS